MATKSSIRAGIRSFFHYKIRKAHVDTGADARTGEQPAKEASDSGEPSLHAAIQTDQTAVVRIALQRHVLRQHLLVEVDDQGTTPLALAVLLGRREIVPLLIDAGAALAPAANRGESLLCLAITTNHLELLQLLIDRGAPLEARDFAGYMPLHRAALNGTAGREMARVLALAGADLEAYGGVEKRTALMYAVEAGNLPVVEELLARGALAHAPRTDGLCPLHVAVGAKTMGLAKVVHEALVRQGRTADVNYGGENSEDADMSGTTPLHYAAGQSTLEMVRWLLEIGADPRAMNKIGETILYWAASNDCGDGVPIMKELVRRGLSVNARQSYGGTPLHLAAWRGLRENVEALLSWGADPKLVATKYHYWKLTDLVGTPEHYARHGGHDELADLLASAVNPYRKISRLDEPAVYVQHEDRSALS